MENTELLPAYSLVRVQYVLMSSSYLDNLLRANLEMIRISYGHFSLPDLHMRNSEPSPCLQASPATSPSPGGGGQPASSSTPGAPPTGRPLRSGPGAQSTASTSQTTTPSTSATKVRQAERNLPWRSQWFVAVHMFTLSGVPSLMVVTILEPPYVMLKCPECEGNERYEGFAIDLLNYISKVRQGCLVECGDQFVLRRTSLCSSTRSTPCQTRCTGCTTTTRDSGTASWGSSSTGRPTLRWLRWP